MCNIHQRRRDARQKRRRGKGRFKFSHINELGEAVFVSSRDGSRYTRSELVTYFGVNLPTPKRFAKAAAKQRSNIRRARALLKELALYGI